MGKIACMGYEHSCTGLRLEHSINQKTKMDSNKFSELSIAKDRNYPDHNILENAFYPLNRAQIPGMVLIFDQEYFEGNCPTREGTGQDRIRFEEVFKNKKFEVECYEDLRLKNIIKTLNIFSNKDYSKYGCLIIAVFSHGNNQGQIYAKDVPYEPKIIWDHFIPNKCPSLKDKPKVIFFQYCRGRERDGGITLTPIEDLNSNSNCNNKIDRCNNNDINEEKNYMNKDLHDERKIIPIDKTSNVEESYSGENFFFSIPDFLIVNSTIPHHVSRRDKSGTWFIQSFCDEITQNNIKGENIIREKNEVEEGSKTKEENNTKKNNSTEGHFLILLTRVFQRVSYRGNNPQPGSTEHMQTSCFVSTLTKLLKI